MRLADVNDHAPSFRHPYYTRAVMENSKPGTPIVSVVADDIDVDRVIQYSLHGPPEIVGEWWPRGGAGQWRGHGRGGFSGRVDQRRGGSRG